ncbi:cDP-diacylglycerol--glycerol-3-phosphate 3-phosphatidyltransferase [Firmicutes bacterium CAG:882]|jgi:CDP-diacylglycerol--glycerol-3-phosphate 3-phosphatidyltransferase|nr:cDP-diacylglycerol--glycerol-3-phosphate 3-phosphatidyltransferase [Firmicutes bacterium CAG:882]
MNLPNKLTIARVIMIPFFLVFLMTDFFEAARYVALAIFIIASLTDMLDGKIARKYNLVTNFGKFMDPLADKLLVCSAMIAFTGMGIMPAWIVIIIIAREFIISGFRLIAAEKNVVIAAGMSGKIKTTVQMIMCCLLIARLPFNFMRYVEQVFIYAALVLTVYSLIVYLVQNKDVLKDN